MLGPVIQGKLVRLRPPRADDVPVMIGWFEDIEHEGRPVGATAIHQINWKFGYGTTGTSIGDRSLWGRGIGKEVMQLRAEYAFTQLPMRKLKSGYYEGNDASARAQAAAGYGEVGRWHRDVFIDGEWRDHILTELLREDWERSRSV